MADPEGRQTLRARNPRSGRAPNGGFIKGCAPGPGRPKKAKIKEAIDFRYGEEPTALDYKAAVIGVNGLVKKADDIPRFNTVQELQVWVFSMRAIAGSTQHSEELLGRSDPKPGRLNIELNKPRTTIEPVAEDVARSWYDNLMPEAN